MAEKPIERPEDYSAFISEKCLHDVIRIMATEVFGGEADPAGRIVVDADAYGLECKPFYAELGAKLESTMAEWYIGCGDPRIDPAAWKPFIEAAAVSYVPLPREHVAFERVLAQIAGIVEKAPKQNADDPTLSVLIAPAAMRSMGVDPDSVGSLLAYVEASDGLAAGEGTGAPRLRDAMSSRSPEHCLRIAMDFPARQRAHAEGLSRALGCMLPDAEGAFAPAKSRKGWECGAARAPEPDLGGDIGRAAACAKVATQACGPEEVRAHGGR